MFSHPIMNILGLFLLGLVIGFGSIVSPILPQFAEQLGASYVEIGLFFSAYSLTWAFLQLYTGYLSDKFGRKKFIVLGLTTYGLSLILSGFSRSFTQLIIFRVIQGVGLGLYAPACLGLVAQMKQKGRGFASYRTANIIGHMTGPIIGGVIGSINLVFPFFVGGILALLATSFVLLINEEEYQGEMNEGFFASLKGIALSKKLILFTIAAFTAELAYVSLDIIIPLFGSLQGFSTISIGFILSSYSIAFILFQIPIGIVSEKINKRLLLGICSFLGAIPFVLLSYFHDFIPMILALGALGLTLGTIFVQSSVYIAEIAPEGKKSLYMAFFDSIIDFSFVVMPPIATLAFSYVSIAPFILCTFLMIFAGIIFLKTR
jgi:MFS family permease